MYNGPFWPQPARIRSNEEVAITVARRARELGDFTIEWWITVNLENALEFSMTETEFLDLADATLNAIEGALEKACDDGDLDVECSRSGNVLEIECIDNGSKIIVNSQAPMQELWIAARSGGFHYKYDGQRWLNTRDGSEMYAALSEVVSSQSGVQVTLQA